MEVTTNKVFDLLLESAKVTEKEISVSHDHSHDDHNHDEEDHEGHDHE